MAGRISPSESNGLALIRSVNRSVVYTDSTDLDILEWLDDNPRIREIRTSHPGSIAEILMLRIARHMGRPADITAPYYQQTAFETPPQSLGMGGLLVGAVLLRLLLRRIFDSSPTGRIIGKRGDL